MLMLILFVLVYCTDGSGFQYPDKMPPPMEAQMDFFRAHNSVLDHYETPIQVRMVHALGLIGWNCLAQYHNSALNALYQERPRIQVPDHIVNEYGNSNTTMLCYVYADAIVAKFLLPEITDTMNSILNNFGINTSLSVINQDAIYCNNNPTCLQTVAESFNYSPDIMGCIVAIEMIDFLNNDGWNADGKINMYGNECTANCRAYSDTTNYIPKNNQYRKKCRAKSKYWTPLIEDNEKGFFYHSNHVTPHIGWTVTPRTMTRHEFESYSATNPDNIYNYRLEEELVLERLKKLAHNDTQKMLVEFMDNKRSYAGAIFLSIEDGLRDQWTFEDRQLWLVGNSVSAYDSTLQVWLEKVRWNRIRPSTRIQKIGCKKKCKKGRCNEYEHDEKIRTWAGPYKGVNNISRMDFKPYIRTMPHSEYPSGSACICGAEALFSAKFLKQNYGHTIQVNLTFIAGSSQIETGMTPQEDLNIHFNLREYAATCSESRLWGGMHFTPSIESGYQLCKHIGDKAYEFANSLLGRNKRFYL
eukprot:467641_1